MHTREQSSKTQLLLLKYIGGFHLFRDTNVCSNKTFFLVVIVFVHDGILMAKATMRKRQRDNFDFFFVLF